MKAVKSVHGVQFISALWKIDLVLSIAFAFSYCRTLYFLKMSCAEFVNVLNIPSEINQIKWYYSFKYSLCCVHKCSHRNMCKVLGMSVVMSQVFPR